MAVAALIQFTQGMTVTPAGEAMVGATGVAVTVANADNTGVVSRLWRIESVPIGSAVPIGNLSVNPTANFTPDVMGSYLVSCRVQGALVTDFDTDYRVFSVVNEMGWIIPAFHGNADAHNYGGQVRGWAGTATYRMLDILLGYVSTMLHGAAPDDVLTYNGATWGPAPIPDQDPFMMYLTGDTADAATPVVLRENGSIYMLPIPATYASATFHAVVNGIGAGGEHLSAVLEGTISRGVLAATTTIVGQTIDYLIQDNVSMTVTAVANLGSAGLEITVTGVAATAMKWTAAVQIAQAYFPII